MDTSKIYHPGMEALLSLGIGVNHQVVPISILSEIQYADQDNDGFYEVELLEDWQAQDIAAWGSQRTPYRTHFPKGHRFSVEANIIFPDPEY